MKILRLDVSLTVILCAAALVIGVDTYAQSCILPAPAAPPVPTVLVVSLPGDGGTQGCTAHALVPGGMHYTEFSIGNAKCAVAVGIAQQAAANDNGWSDGGTP